MIDEPQQREAMLEKLRALDLEEQRACMQEINAVLQRHNYQIAAQAFITDDGRIAARATLVKVPAVGP